MRKSKAGKSGGKGLKREEWGYVHSDHDNENQGIGERSIKGNGGPAGKGLGRVRAVSEERGTEKFSEGKPRSRKLDQSGPSQSLIHLEEEPRRRARDREERKQFRGRGGNLGNRGGKSYPFFKGV